MVLVVLKLYMVKDELCSLSMILGSYYCLLHINFFCFIYLQKWKGPISLLKFTCAVSSDIQFFAQVSYITWVFVHSY